MHDHGVERLKNELAYYRALFDHACDGLVVLNEKREIVYMNRASRKMTGLDPKPGTPCGELFDCHNSEDQSLRDERCLGKCVLSGEQDLEDVEMTIRTINGGKIPVAVSYSLIPYGSEKYILMSIRNLMNRKRSEELFYTVRERERLARDLHDGVVQNIAYAGMQMKALQAVLKKGDWAKVQKKTEDLVEILNDCYKELRQAIYDLTFKVDERLVQFLRDYAAEFQMRTNIQTVVHVEDVPDKVDPFVANQVARVMQEALANVRKHAQASLVKIECVYRGGRLELRVKDDGVGFEPQAEREGDHYGMTTMRDRAALIGGVIRLYSQPGKGTTVHMSVPYEDHEKVTVI